MRGAGPRSHVIEKGRNPGDARDQGADLVDISPGPGVRDIDHIERRNPADTMTVIEL